MIVASGAPCSDPYCRGYIWIVWRTSLTEEVIISQTRESLFTELRGWTQAKESHNPFESVLTTEFMGKCGHKYFQFQAQYKGPWPSEIWLDGDSKQHNHVRHLMFSISQARLQCCGIFYLNLCFWE